MLTLYIACLVFGGVLLVISLFSGGDSDVDAGHDLGSGAGFDHGLDGSSIGHDLQLEASHDIHITAADTGQDMPVEVHADIDHVPDAGGGMQEAGHHDALSSALQFFSFRNMVYMTTFFGLTGTVLSLTGAGFALSLAASSGIGIFAAGVGHRFMQYLKKTESGQATDLARLVGVTARVSLPVGKSHKGKVILRAGDQQLQLLAILDVSSEHEELPVGSAVVVLRMEQGIAFVDLADYIDS